MRAATPTPPGERAKHTVVLPKNYDDGQNFLVCFPRFRVMCQPMNNDISSNLTMTGNGRSNMSSNMSANAVDPVFQEKIERLKEYYFSRNPAYWPVFGDAGLKQVVDFRRLNLAPGERIDAYPNGKQLTQQIQQGRDIPQAMRVPNGVSDEILNFSGALSKDWENPASVENVVTMPCDPGIYGSMIGLLSNPNLVYQEYAGMAMELERYVVRQMANLAGYDPDQATGLFTQGGTFCNLYGYLMGIRKSLPEARQYGMGYIHDYRIINSLGGHYSNITNLSLLGVDIGKRTIRIKVKENNDIDLNDLERQLHACFRLGCAVPTIMLTMGTTDTFAVDRVKPVYELRNRLCEHYDIEVKPHIHVDSAIGWSMLFFLNYDFDANPLHINSATLVGLRDHAARFSELKYADSFTVDFQKWGYVPYTSSLVVFKNKSDMKYLENDPENFSYFESDLQGQTHLQSTIECSRGAVGLFGAYAALTYLGIEGYQAIVASCLQNANYFYCRLKQLANVKIVASGNMGPSVGFRIYDPEIVTDAEQEYDYEYNIQNTEEYSQRLLRNNKWHRELFRRRGKKGLYSNWIAFVTHTDYDAKERYYKLPGEKVVFMNPVTTRKEIDTFIDNLF